MTVISRIYSLPENNYANTGILNIIITSGVPSYFKITGNGLSDIMHVDWYPRNPASLMFESRQLILVNDSLGTFMFRVADNYLDTQDRGGHVSFRLRDNTTIQYPVVTYGPVSVGPLWVAPSQGMITG